MPDWTNPTNGNWTDAAKWTGGVPNAAGATANFIVPNPGSATLLITFSQNAIIRVGTLNLTTDSDQAWAFEGDTGVTSATLRFEGTGGGPAFLNVDTNNSSRLSSIADVNGMNVRLASDLIVTTADEDTVFEIAAPITGAFFDLYKFGSGTLRLSGNNSAMTGEYFLNGGRTELTSAGAVGGGGLIRLNNGATLATTSTFTLANNFETASGLGIGVIAAETGTILTLTGQMELRSRAFPAVTFGSAADAGTIVLAGTSLINGTGGFSVGGGTVLFGNAGVAANYFSGLAPATGIVFVVAGGVLDTGGFAATIDNLAISGGTLQASGGALDVTSDHGIEGSDMQGTVVGTAQADRLVLNIAGSVNLKLLTFNSWTDGIDSITINGGIRSNNLAGSTRNDTINGGDGGDTLQGNGGFDILRGGTGNDNYVIVDTQSTLIENAGEGTDTIFVLNGGPTAFTLAANFENLTFLDGAQNTGVGNAAGNLLTGGTGNDGLQGREGNDTLVGKEGADTLDGGTGVDDMTGGAGNDFYFVDNAGDHAFEKVGEGTDRVFATASFSLTTGQEIETLSTDAFDGTAVMDLSGNEFINLIMGNAAANILAGGGGNDTIVGNAGNDQLIGGTGADVMNGGTGNDLFFVDDSSDQVFDKAGEGNDRVFTSHSFTLATGQEIETLSTDNAAGTAAISLTGNELVNFIMGNAAGNVLNGKGGADTIVGNAGNDTLIGGTGADFMNGGTGDDLFFVDDSSDQVFDRVGEGNDQVFTGHSFTLAAGQEIETLSTDNAGGTAAINLTGNELANTVIGNNGANVLDGKLGNDVLTGNGGADSFAFTRPLGVGNVDTVTDFVGGTDHIALGQAVFNAIGLGTLNPNAFFVGAAAHDADDRIIYNSATGALDYDADGNGAGAAVQFATLTGAPSINASDFTVI